MITRQKLHAVLKKAGFHKAEWARCVWSPGYVIKDGGAHWLVHHASFRGTARDAEQGKYAEALGAAGISWKHAPANGGILIAKEQ